MQQTHALKGVIYFYSFLTVVTAILIWILIPDSKSDGRDRQTLKGTFKVLRNRSAWLQAIIVVCAYCAYRGLDFYSLYGVDILGMNEVSAARFVSYGAYLRVIGAIGAGFLADRFTTRKILVITFIVLILSYLILMIISPDQGVRSLIIGNLIITFLAVYALRGIYFALFEEMTVSSGMTGTTVGLVSVIGYTPDIFFNSIAGRILDASPGIKGYHNFYFFLLIFALLGFAATILLANRIKHQKSI
jgi:nitrate/nitrite transporter NarK